jgi:hypothetical protein
VTDEDIEETELAKDITGRTLQLEGKGQAGYESITVNIFDPRLLPR